MKFQELKPKFNNGATFNPQILTKIQSLDTIPIIATKPTPNFIKGATFTTRLLGKIQSLHEFQ